MPDLPTENSSRGSSRQAILRGNLSSTATLVGTSMPRDGVPPRSIVADAELGRSPTRSWEDYWADDRQLTVTTLNVGAAAAPRARQLLRWLRTRGSDVLVLSETSAGAGTAVLAEGLRASGYQVLGACEPKDRGVLIAVRGLAIETPMVKSAVTLPSRAVCARLDGSRSVSVLGVYVPSRDRSPAKVERKRGFIGSLLSFLHGLQPETRDWLMVVGDFNIVSRRHEPPLRGYFDFEYALFDAVEELGFRLAHELRPARTFPHSWIGRTGIGYLYDYVFVGRALHDRIESCRYLHGPRQNRLSDHAAITVSCRLPSADQAAADCSVLS